LVAVSNSGWTTSSRSWLKMLRQISGKLEFAVDLDSRATDFVRQKRRPKVSLLQSHMKKLRQQVPKWITMRCFHLSPFRLNIDFYLSD